MLDPDLTHENFLMFVRNESMARRKLTPSQFDAASRILNRAANDYRRTQVLTLARKNVRRAPGKFEFGNEVIRFMPIPALRIGSMNLAGVKGPGRLEQAFCAAQAARLDVFLAQEHGLHEEDAAYVRLRCTSVIVRR